MRKLIFAIILIIGAACVAQNVDIEEIKRMISRGDLEDAAAMLDSIGRKQPRNAEVDLLRGRMLMAEFRDMEARESLQAAKKKGSNDANLDLAELAVRNYEVDEADELLDAYRSYISRNRRKNLTDESGDLDERISRIRTMLDRVEDIVVIDSLIVDADDFFKAYKLAPDAGRLVDAAGVAVAKNAAEATPVYITEDGRKMLWAEPAGEQGDLHLKSSDHLLGDEWSEPEEVGDFLSAGADAAYPFLMPDGVTLYYASNGRGSIGGYDIFITRDNGNGFLEPQNVGMPYNSPYDDYMLAIDEVTGAGWWATDRNHLPGEVTIYRFVPADMRKNVSVDDDELIARASLRNIALTQPEGSDYSALKAAIERNGAAVAASADDAIEFYMPDGRVIRSKSEVSDGQALARLERYLNEEQSLKEMEARLAQLRSEWHSGNGGSSSAIMKLEQQLTAKRASVKALRNEAIKALSR